MIAQLRRRVAEWAAPELRQLSVDQQLLNIARGMAGGTAGMTVTESSALALTAVFDAIDCISTDVAMLPLKVYRHTEGGREVVRDHPVATLLSSSPDGETTPIRFKQALMGHVLGWGNGFAEIVYRGDGTPARLHLLDPGTTEPRWDGPDKSLLYHLQGKPNPLPPSKVIHIAGLGFDGLSGYNRIRKCAPSVGLGLALEQFGASFFENGSMPGGVLESPKVLSPQEATNLRESWEAMHRGASKAGKVAVLEQGVTYKGISISPENAQFLQSRQFQVIEVARMFRLPPHKLGDYSQSHLANIEAANLDYMTTTIAPWLEQIEQELNLKLFTEEERRAGFYVKHSMNAYLRGDMRSRAEFYMKMFAVGALSPNDIRGFEEQNPVEGGDQYFRPLNLAELAQAANPTPPAPNAEGGDS